MRNLGSLGVLIDQFEQVSEFTAAEQDMDIITEGDEDTASFILNSVPIPITHKSFRVSLRHLEASRTIGAPIDTTNVELATRQVVEKLEDTLFNGGDVVVGGDSIFGYTNHPDRNTGALTAPWTTVATRDILRDVINMTNALEADSYFGPYMFYVPIAFLERAQRRLQSRQRADVPREDPSDRQHHGYQADRSVDGLDRRRGSVDE